MLPFFQSKEEVMAVRLREADSMAAVAELRQKIAELEIQVRNTGHSHIIHVCLTGLENFMKVLPTTVSI